MIERNKLKTLVQSSLRDKFTRLLATEDRLDSLVDICVDLIIEHSPIVNRSTILDDNEVLQVEYKRPSHNESVYKTEKLICRMIASTSTPELEGFISFFVVNTEEEYLIVLNRDSIISMIPGTWDGREFKASKFDKRD